MYIKNKVGSKMAIIAVNEKDIEHNTYVLHKQVITAI